MVDLDEAQLAKLARELVMNIRPYTKTFEDFGIDENDYQQIEKNEFFRKVKEHYTIEWNSTNSSEERVRLIHLAYLEQLSPVLGRRAMQPDANLGQSTDVGKLFMKGAGIGEAKAEKTNADRFVITINLGADTETFDKPLAVGVEDGPSINAKSKEPPVIELRTTREGEGA
jgi:hypothetical protein